MIRRLFDIDLPQIRHATLRFQGVLAQCVIDDGARHDSCLHAHELSSASVGPKQGPSTLRLTHEMCYECDALHACGGSAPESQRLPCPAGSQRGACLASGTRAQRSGVKTCRWGERAMSHVFNPPTFLRCSRCVGEFSGIQETRMFGDEKAQYPSRRAMPNCSCVRRPLKPQRDLARACVDVAESSPNSTHPAPSAARTSNRRRLEDRGRSKDTHLFETPQWHRGSRPTHLGLFSLFLHSPSPPPNAPCATVRLSPAHHMKSTTRSRWATSWWRPTEAIAGRARHWRRRSDMCAHTLRCRRV